MTSTNELSSFECEDISSAKTSCLLDDYYNELTSQLTNKSVRIKRSKVLFLLGGVGGHPSGLLLLV